MIQYSTVCTQLNNFECKISVRLWTHERHTYLTLPGELWVSLVSYLEKSDCEILGGHRIIPGGWFNTKKSHLTSIESPFLEVRQSYDHLISTMWFPMLVRRHLYIGSRPRTDLYLSRSTWCTVIVWQLCIMGEPFASVSLISLTAVR